MRKILVLGLVLVFGVCFGQEKLLNSDGTLSDEFKRQYFLEFFNKGNENLNRRYDIEDAYFVIIIKQTFDKQDSYTEKQIQSAVMNSTLYCLTHEIDIQKRLGYKIFLDNSFKGIIFKINTLINQETKRYNFKFSLDELVAFPEYMDSKEMYDYLVKNENRNIIYAKNGLEETK